MTPALAPLERSGCALFSDPPTPLSMKIKDLEVVRHRLETPLVVHGDQDRELYIHALVGRGEVLFADERAELGGRLSIFSPPDEGLLVSNHDCVIQPHGPLDVLLAYAHVSDDGALPSAWRRVTPIAHEIGDGNHKRTVYEILGGDGPSTRLRCGETFNVKGGWSSWPPHSFDHDPKLAPEFEEIFVPFLRPKNGSALLRRNGTFQDGETIDDAFVLRSGEMVEVPLGSHPIVGGPDTDLMYFWAYLCPTPKVYGKWAEDCGSYA